MALQNPLLMASTARSHKIQFPRQTVTLIASSENSKRNISTANLTQEVVKICLFSPFKCMLFYCCPGHPGISKCLRPCEVNLKGMCPKDPPFRFFENHIVVFQNDAICLRWAQNAPKRTKKFLDLVFEMFGSDWKTPLFGWKTPFRPLKGGSFRESFRRKTPLSDRFQVLKPERVPERRLSDAPFRFLKCKIWTWWT